jgi:hypothetical protein
MLVFLHIEMNAECEGRARKRGGAPVRPKQNGRSIYKTKPILAFLIFRYQIDRTDQVQEARASYASMRRSTI